ncbi:MAG: hypothetical protein ABUK01_03135 [Leptospirales bacterium]
MGSNFSGVIIAKGEHGSWATYRCLDKKHIRLKPTELSHQEVVAMIIAGCVAYGMLLYSNVKSERCNCDKFV